MRSQEFEHFNIRVLGACTSIGGYRLLLNRYLRYVHEVSLDNTEYGVTARVNFVRCAASSPDGWRCGSVDPLSVG